MEITVDEFPRLKVMRRNSEMQLPECWLPGRDCWKEGKDQKEKVISRSLETGVA